MKNFTKDRNIGIDLLRGASMLYIVGFWHMFGYTNYIFNYNNLVTYRLTIVILGIFVFISGCFIGKKEIYFNKPCLLLFFKNRVIRIYPLYLLAVYLFAIFDLSSFKTSFKAACGISMFAKPAPHTLWFITMLIGFYIISPLLIVVCRTTKTSRFLLCCFVIIMLLWAYMYFTNLLDLRIIVYFPAFGLGVFVANNSINNFHRRYIFLIIMIFSVLVSFLINIPDKQMNLLVSTPMVTLCPLFLFSALKDFVVSSKKVYKAIFCLSYSSYCMYLFHRPIYIVLKKLYFPETYFLQLVYLVIFCLPCIIMFSYIIQKLYDITVCTITNKFKN